MEHLLQQAGLHTPRLSNEPCSHGHRNGPHTLFRPNVAVSVCEKGEMCRERAGKAAAVSYDV